MYFQGCYVSGIFIEGGRWDLKKQCLAISESKILIESLPIISIVPIEANRLKLLVTFTRNIPFLKYIKFKFYFQNTIRTPVYTTTQRRNAMGVGLVFEADLKTQDHNSFWILQGVCLILNDD